MINSLGLVMRGNTYICVTVSYKQEYQPTDEKYNISVAKATQCKEKSRKGSRSAHSMTQSSPFLVQPLGCCVHAMVSWCGTGAGLRVLTWPAVVTDTVLLCLTGVTGF